MSNAIIGLIVGEGSFQMALYKRDRNKFGIQARPNFTLDMHIEDENTVEYAHRETGIGYFNTYTSNESARWEASNGPDCKSLEEYIREHSGDLWEQSMKSDSFERWCSLRSDRKELIQSQEGMHELIDRAANVNDWGESKTDWHSVVENNC